MKNMTAVISKIDIRIESMNNTRKIKLCNTEILCFAMPLRLGVGLIEAGWKGSWGLFESVPHLKSQFQPNARQKA